ncbi:MAG: hypothetical protein ABMB14_33450 [Myxococcota bacterium]
MAVGTVATTGRRTGGWTGKKVDALEKFEWTYDDVGRVATYFQGGDTMGYAYDGSGNPLEAYRYGEGHWTYAATTRFNEVPSRVLDLPAPVTESMAYDPVTGGLVSWETDHPDPARDVVRQFEYDGLGRLRWALHQTAARTDTSDLYYDARVRHLDTSRPA